MVEDVSKHTVLILVVLTLIISVLSLFTVLETINSRSNYIPVSIANTNIANQDDSGVHLQIEKPTEPVLTTGHVILNIIN